MAPETVIRSSSQGARPRNYKQKRNTVQGLRSMTASSSSIGAKGPNKAPHTRHASSPVSSALKPVQFGLNSDVDSESEWSGRNAERLNEDAEAKQRVYDLPSNEYKNLQSSNTSNYDGPPAFNGVGSNDPTMQSCVSRRPVVIERSDSNLVLPVEGLYVFFLAISALVCSLLLIRGISRVGLIISSSIALLIYFSVIVLEKPFTLQLRVKVFQSFLDPLSHDALKLD